MTGYGPNGFFTPASGLATFPGSGPPILKRELPAESPVTSLGFGRIPRRVKDSNEVFRVKTS